MIYARGQDLTEKENNLCADGPTIRFNPAAILDNTSG